MTVTGEGKSVRFRRAALMAETFAVIYEGKLVNLPHQSNCSAGIVTAAVANCALVDAEVSEYTLRWQG